MKLVYLNAELDSSKEHELFNITENGFKVTIKYLPTSWRYEKGRKEETFENCTEVHNLFESIFDEKAIAFESDIQATGFVRKIDEIEEVVIDLM